MATFYTSNLVQVISRDTTIGPGVGYQDIYTIPTGHYGRLLWFYAGRNSSFTTTTTIGNMYLKILQRTSPSIIYTYFNFFDLLEINTSDYISYKRAFANTQLSLSVGDTLAVVLTNENIRYQLILEIYKEF